MGRCCELCSCHRSASTAARTRRVSAPGARWGAGTARTPGAGSHPGTGHPRGRRAWQGGRVGKSETVTHFFPQQKQLPLCWHRPLMGTASRAAHCSEIQRIGVCFQADALKSKPRSLLLPLLPFRMQSTGRRAPGMALTGSSQLFCSFSLLHITNPLRAASFLNCLFPLIPCLNTAHSGG